MKRIYVVKVERGNNFDHWTYNVVASNGDEASRKAMRQARADSGYQTGWRLSSLTERPERVVS